MNTLCRCARAEGRRGRTLVIAYVATLAGTLYARVGIALGPDRPLGPPPRAARLGRAGG